MSTNLKRSRKLGRIGRGYRDIAEARELYNAYLDSCIEVGTEPGPEVLEDGLKLRAKLIIYQDIIDRIKDNLPKQEKDFIRWYYFEGYSFGEACRKIGATNAQGERIRREALQHFDEVETKHEAELAALLQGRIIKA